MRTNIDIDQDLIKAAQEATGIRTKKAVVEEGLRRLVKYKRQLDALRDLKGCADWEGDIRSLRADREIAQW